MKKSDFITSFIADRHPPGKGEPEGRAVKVSIFVGGPPAHTLAAVMPLPEGLVS